MKPTTLQIRTRNDEFQLLHTLQHNRKKRSKQGRFIVEGVRSIDQLRASGSSAWAVDGYVYSQQRELSDWAREVLDSAPARRHIALTDELMKELSEREETSELMAVVDMPHHGLHAIPVVEHLSSYTEPSGGGVGRDCRGAGV